MPDSPSPLPPGNSSRSHHTSRTATTPAIRMHARADRCTAYGRRYIFEVYQSGPWSSSSISDERYEKFKIWRADARSLDFDGRVWGWHTYSFEKYPGGHKQLIFHIRQAHQKWTQIIDPGPWMTKIESNLLVCKEVAFEKVTISRSRLSISEKMRLRQFELRDFWRFVVSRWTFIWCTLDDRALLKDKCL